MNERNERKVRALMAVIKRLAARQVVLDKPSFELFELAKRIRRAKTHGEFKGALEALVGFNK